MAYPYANHLPVRGFLKRNVINIASARSSRVSVISCRR
jgi:hypothetical protein